jgi:hypothetical protein
MQLEQLGIVAAVAGAVLSATACGADGNTGAERGLTVVLDSQGEALYRFAVVAACEGKAVVVECGADAVLPESASCGIGSARLDVSWTTLGTVTVKAPGFATTTTEVLLGGLPRQEGANVLAVTLKPLEGCKDTEDYVTCLDDKGGASRFEELAYAAESEFGPSQSVKFYIAVIKGDPTVYFQDTKKHPIHYDFAHEVLGVALSPDEYVMQTYMGPDRSAMAGTLVYYPALESSVANLEAPLKAPIALTFFPSDDLAPAQALLAYRLIEERMGFLRYSGGAGRIGYLPAGSVQDDQLASATDAFDAAGALYLPRVDLYAGITLQLLNPGIAYGTLRKLSPVELEKTVVSFGDVLLLTRLPSELPIVGGTITEEMQTPLAHVNVAARTRGTPNMALAEASTDPKIAGLIGKLVRLEVTKEGYSLEKTTLAEAEEYWESIKKEPMSPPFDDEPADLVAFKDLAFGDSLSLGVKAANLGVLHQLLPGDTPDGFAVPFRYYDEFMSTVTVTASGCDAAQTDCVVEGRDAAVCSAAWGLCKAGVLPESLWDYAKRVTQDPGFRSDTLVREAALDGLRYQMRNADVDPGFGAALDERVGELANTAKVRLRSSTNSEDLEEFSGAGLYDSVSAVASGDDAASGEIRKVWASAWGWRAFEERSFWSIDHFAVRMGVCVNPAFQDEKANGVVITQNIADPMTVGMYVNVQVGEGAVTNPEEGALPEVFSIIPGPGGAVQVARQRYSSLSPSKPLLSDKEVQALYDACTKAHNHFAKLYGKYPASIAFDIEFKFHGPERKLFLKQIRPYTDW